MVKRIHASLATCPSELDARNLHPEQFVTGLVAVGDKEPREQWRFLVHFADNSRPYDSLCLTQQFFSHRRNGVILIFFFLRYLGVQLGKFAWDLKRSAER